MSLFSFSKNKEEKAQLNAIDEHFAVISFSPDGIILEANQNFLNTLGYTENEVLGKKCKTACADAGYFDLKDLNDINLVGVDHEGNPGGPYTVVATPTAVPGDDVEKARFITVTVTRNGGIGGHPVTLRCLTQGNGV